MTVLLNEAGKPCPYCGSEVFDVPGIGVECGNMQCSRPGLWPSDKQDRMTRSFLAPRIKDGPQRRTSEEVAAGQDPKRRAAMLEKSRQGFKLRTAGKYRLSVDVPRELMERVRGEAKRRGFTISRLVERLLEEGLK